MKNRGLKGDSGMVAPGLHVAASYGCNGMVFVEVFDEEAGITWARKSLVDTNKLKLPVIRCSMCNRPATSLDHYFPYYQDMNRCDKHIGVKV